jgi:hypothetical protein
MPRRTSSLPKVNTSQVHNRILALMAHTNRYAFKGESRLAADAGVSKSLCAASSTARVAPPSLWSRPLLAPWNRTCSAGLEGRRLDPHELISLDGTYPPPPPAPLPAARDACPPKLTTSTTACGPSSRT